VLSEILASDTARFVRAFVRDPVHTASVAPSSPALAGAMAAALPATGQPTVVELGTGPVTSAIQRTLGGRGRHMAIERNPQWVALLRERFPGVEVVHGDVADLTGILADHDVGPADAVVSGLPWAAYRGRFVADLADVLAPTGVFSQFAYAWARRWAPPARAELAALRGHFADVAISATIWRNLPPAVVYYARGPVVAR
jgi:phosphatidylethanolamine/phosphatidyl-N-methylethanolamine N-methyltransferase